MKNSNEVSGIKEKTTNCWPLSCHLSLYDAAIGRWAIAQWRLDGFELRPKLGQNKVSLLHLFKDERSEYRFNLSSASPKLFVVLDIDLEDDVDLENDVDVEDLDIKNADRASAAKPALKPEDKSMTKTNQPSIVCITAAQSVAASYMDGDYLVLSHDMPLPVQAWMEAFIGRHGEQLEMRRKKRRGAGRASG